MESHDAQTFEDLMDAEASRDEQEQRVESEEPNKNDHECHINEVY